MFQPHVHTHASHFDENNKIIDENIHEHLREMTSIFVKYCKLSKGLLKETIDQH